MAEPNVLKFYVRGQNLKKTAPARLVADTINYFSAEFVFDDAWEGMSPWAHLTYNDTNTYDINIVNGRIPETSALNLIAGDWSIYLTGDISEPFRRITTEPVYFVVEPTMMVNGEPLPEITPTVAEQIDAKAQAAVDARITAAYATVDTGIGTPSVGVEVGGDPGSKHIEFAFHNLKGNGIDEVSFDEDNILTIEETNGAVTEFDGIANAIESMSELEDSVESAESSRATAESARATAETARASSESARVTAETSRESAETARVLAETSRVSSETSRTSAEIARASAETARESAETARASAESSRVSAESARVTAEAGRVANEIRTASASVNNNVGTPSVVVTKSANNIDFAFSNLKGDTGATGPQGEPGSDAEVTAQNIASALGYTPADDAEVDTLSQTVSAQSSQIETLDEEKADATDLTAEVTRATEAENTLGAQIASLNALGFSVINGEINITFEEEET